MDRIRNALGELPVVVRHVVLGAITLGAIGGIAGLVVGLRTYAPTAWAATFEVGTPAAVLGALLGVVTGSVARAVRLRRSAE